jgi:hypothetical protein
MSTLRLTTISNQDGSATVPSQTVISGSAKAWVNFNGTGTVAIRASFNVTSITDNGTGNYTVNFTTAFADASYSCVTGIKDDTGAAPSISFGSSGGIYSTTQVRLQAWTYTGVQYDSSIINLAIFR